MEVHVSPAMLAGITTPGGKIISPEAEDLITRLKDHYRQQGKASAAHNYSRHLKTFFSWAERLGYSIKSLPPDAVESFLSTLAAAGQKVASVYVIRTQLKGALKAASEVFGAPFGHLEYISGKPTEVHKKQKDKEKKQRAEKRIAQSAQTLQAIQAAQKTIFGAGAVATGPLVPTAQAIPMPTDTIDSEANPMIDAGAPQATGTNVAGATQAPQTIVLNVPANTGGNARVTTIAAGNQQQNRPAAVSDRPGIRINSLVFNGAYVKVSYVADGASPLVAPGTPVQLQVYPTSQIAIHGDVSTFLQSFVIPTMRLAPTTAQVQFIFEELNEKRHPTGRRDEIVVAVPNGTLGAPMQQASAPAPAAVTYLGQAPQNDAMTNTMTNFVLQRLERDADEAKKRAEALQEEMKKASDAQTTFLLMQQHRQAEDLRRELEEQKRREIDRMERANSAPPPMALTPAMPFPTILPPEPAPRDNTAAEFAKALADSQKNMMELVLATLNKPVPAPAPPPVQKDAAEWLVPFMAQMNQQSQQQQQANQQMIVQIMQANQQFMQALLTRENPMEKLLFTQLQEVKAAANSPKADELESFADKLQKMKMVSDMLGGGGNTNLLSELLANADTIGAGAAKVIQAAKMGGSTPTPQQLAKAPTAQAQGQAPALPPAQGVTTPTIPPPPEEALAQLAAVTAGVEATDEQAIINGVVELVKALMGAPEPYPMQGRRILAAFQNADDEGELYTLAKNLWTILGQQYDRPAAKAVARALAKWYSVIHQQIFGEPKELLESQDEGDDEDGEEQDDSDDAPTMVAGG